MKRKKVNIISGFFDVKTVNYFLNNELRDPSDNFYYEIINYDINKFNDNEKSISFKKLNGDFVLIFQSLQCEFLEEFLLKVQKVLATDKKIILVITYLFYLRQSKDLKEKFGETIIKSLLNYENIIKKEGENQKFIKCINDNLYYIIYNNTAGKFIETELKIKKCNKFFNGFGITSGEYWFTI